MRAHGPDTDEIVAIPACRWEDRSHIVAAPHHPLRTLSAFRRRHGILPVPAGEQLDELVTLTRDEREGCSRLPDCPDCFRATHPAPQRTIEMPCRHLDFRPPEYDHSLT
nr:hypothetical protein [Burkholderia ambifaria]